MTFNKCKYTILILFLVFITMSAVYKYLHFKTADSRMDLKVVLLVAVCFCVMPVQVGGWKYIYYQYFSLLTKYKHLYGELQELKDLLASLTKG